MSDQPKPPGPMGTACPVCGLFSWVNKCEPGNCKTPKQQASWEGWNPNAPGPANPPCPSCGDKPHPDGPCACTFSACACLKLRNEKAEAWNKAMMEEWGRREFAAMDAAREVPVEAAPEPAPVILSRPEVGAPPAVEHPAPWRWGPAGYPKPDEFGRPETLALYDANGDEVIGTDGDDWSWLSCDDPRVRELVRAAPQLHTGVIALLDIINQMVADAWPKRIAPEDAGPICANLRALTDAIDGRKRPGG